jgi:lysozyme family protein
MSMTDEELISLAKDLTNIVFDESLPDDERDLAEDTLEEIEDDAIAAALRKFRQGTSKLVTLTGDLLDGIRDLGGPPSPKLAQIADRLGALHAAVHDAEGMRTTWESSEEFAEVFHDEDELPPTGIATSLPPRPQGVTALSVFKPVNSRKFPQLADEYIQFFLAQDYKSESARKDVEKQAKFALKHKQRYVDVGAPLAIPWWFVAGIHMLESSFNFTRHLHNGDSLKARTFRVPAGRPVAGNPPFTWEESARDALTGERLNDQADWSLARALYRWEAYNGFGYRRRSVPTPYLWSFSNVYTKGKFVGDGVFSANAKSQQVGAAVFLKGLLDLQEVDLGVETVPEGEGDAVESDLADADAALAAELPNIDGVIATNPDFKTFFETRAPDVTDFKWHEFFVKGGSHSIPTDPAFGLNTDPPFDLWENVLPLARVLQRIRQEIGHPMVLTSVYRSDAYNNAIPGSASNSQHLYFKAADFKVPGHGNSSDWFAAARRLRDQGVFSGGLGLYNTFVHVDVRGHNTTW